MIINNIYEGLINQLYYILLYYFTWYSNLKLQFFFENLNTDCFVILEQYLNKLIYYIFFKNIISYNFCIGDFTLRLL